MLNNSSKVSVIDLGSAKKLDLKIKKTNVGAQKIDGSTLEIYGIVITNFQIEDKTSRPRFFKKTFLVTNTKFEMIVKMFFLKISNINLPFGKEILR